MNKRRQWISLLLVVCMVIGMVPTTVFAKNVEPFSDVNSSDWYYNAVAYVYEHNMMGGTGNGQFSPDALTTRGMLVTILHRMEGTPEAQEAQFVDVAPGAYYEKAIAWASETGLVDGYGSGRFGPDDLLTREQMVTILFRYSKMKGLDVQKAGSTAGFADGTTISGYAKESMGWAIGAGLISGYNDNTVRPAVATSRAVAATILTRFCQEILTPVVEETYTVTFSYNNGSSMAYKTMEVTKGETVDRPADPSRSGYTFAGWFMDSNGKEAMDFQKAITENRTVYAKWTKNSPVSSGPVSGGSTGGNHGDKDDDDDTGSTPEPGSGDTYTVTFMRNDESGGAHVVDTVKDGAKLTAPEDPERLGYGFTGWFTSAHTVDVFDFTTPIHSDIVLYAGWGNPSDNKLENGVFTTESGGGTTAAITDVIIEGGKAKAVVNTEEIAVLEIKFLTDEGTSGNTPAELGCAYAQTPEYCEMVPVATELPENLPDYYLVQAMLYDSNGNPLMEHPFETIQYTENYEKFLQQTVSSLKAEGKNVINFDHADDVNFGVLAEDVVYIEKPQKMEAVETEPSLETDGDLMVDSADTYVFPKASKEILTLKTGDSVAVKDKSGEVHLFVVDTITTDGKTVTITTKDAELVDFYTTLNVSTEVSIEQQNPDDQVVSLGAAPQDSVTMLSKKDVHVEDQHSASLGLEIAWENKDETLKISGDVKGTGTVSVKIVYDIVLFGKDYVETEVSNKLDIEANVGVTLKIDNEPDDDDDTPKKNVIEKKTLNLGKLNVPTAVAGLTVGMEISVPMEWKLSASGELVYTSSSTTGFTYNTKSGRQNIDKKERSLDISFEGKAEVKFGLKVELNTAFAKKMVKASVEAYGGIMASFTLPIDINLDTNADCKHGCTLCLEGKLKWFLEAEAKLSYDLKVIKGVILEVKLLDVEGFLSLISGYPGECYISVLNSPDSMFHGHIHVGGGSCPNKTWRTTFVAEDENGTPVDATITVKKDGQVVASGDSQFVKYLYDGAYIATATVNGATLRNSFTVNKDDQTVVLSADFADGKLQGSVVDKDGNAISGATVLVKQGNTVFYSGSTNTSGNYAASLPSGTYMVTIRKFGYMTFTISVTIENNRTKYLETAMLQQEGFGLMGGISGTITDAVTGAPVSGVTLEFREGWDNTDGEVVNTLATNSSGQYEKNVREVFGVKFGLMAGNYTVSASKSGYVTSRFNVVVMPNVNTANQNGTITKRLQDGADYRVVLTWGATPRDLDSHYVGGSDHVYFSDKVSGSANLDVDDTSSYGPETITVTDFDGLANGFTYLVHDFTNASASNSTALSNSGAVVKLYQEGVLLETYNVPVNRGGTVWNVFSIDANGRIHDNNEFSYVSSASAVGSSGAS